MSGAVLSPGKGYAVLCTTRKDERAERFHEQ